MTNNDNIEQLFKEKLDNFEADVNPKVWADVQKKIQSSNDKVTVAGKMSLGKIVGIGAFIVALAGGSAWYYTYSDNSTTTVADEQQKTETAKQPVSQNDVTTSQTTNTSEENPNNNNGSEQQTSTAASNQNTTTASKPQNEKAPTAQQQPVAHIIADSKKEGAVFIISFSNQGNASSLLWEFGDGTTSRELKPIHTYDKPGSYDVKLTAKNALGTDVDEITIELTPASSIGNIPNIFTPNYDGKNDYFNFETDNIESLEVIISDSKTMQTIYKWSGLEGKWDGKQLNGADAPDGNYLYAIRATGHDGNAHIKKGTVTLKR